MAKTKQAVETKVEEVQDVFILTPQEQIQLILDEWARANGQMAKADVQLGSERMIKKAVA